MPNSDSSYEIIRVTPHGPLAALNGLVGGTYMQCNITRNSIDERSSGMVRSEREIYIRMVFSLRDMHMYIHQMVTHKTRSYFPRLISSYMIPTNMSRRQVEEMVLRIMIASHPIVCIVENGSRLDCIAEIDDFFFSLVSTFQIAYNCTLL